MDPLTHGLIGYSAANSRAGWIRSPGGLVILVGAALLPDIDVVVTFLDPAYATLHRRTASHSLLGLLVLCLLWTFLMSRIFNDYGTPAIFRLSLAGLSLHLLLDLINAFGVALLYPFSLQRFEWPLVFVVDPVLFLVPSLALLAWLVFKHYLSRSLLHGIVLIILLGYLGSTVYAKNASGILLEQHLERETLDHEKVYLLPEPLAPWFWKGIVKTAQGYDEFLIRPFSKDITDLGIVISDMNHHWVQRARSTDAYQYMEPFLKMPVWQVSESGVTVHDRRFRYALIKNQWDPFEFRFVNDGDTLKYEPLSNRSKWSLFVHHLRVFLDPGAP